MIVIYFFTLFILTVYSYTQIDLNLTLLQTSWFLSFQQKMIQLGYFERPTSTVIFVFLLSALSIFYVLFLKRDISLNKVIILIGGICFLGILSYPAFSHDLFNSIFYPRIIFEHGANPYQVTALMFPADTWTRFMHWTHNTYQWGPVYLLLTFPFYLLGFGRFILTLFWFKTMGVLAYIVCCYFVYKIAKKPGLVLFAFNPLIILEGVISGHLDIIMLAFALAGIRYRSLILLFLSIGVKFATVTILPFFFLRSGSLVIILAILGSLTQIYYRADFLPHYFIVPMGIISLYPDRKKLVITTLIISIALLFIRYLPFLYTAHWLAIKLY